MARRPFIETKIIRGEFRPQRSASRPDGYIAGPASIEVIGMDGRNDWFRANCRECGHKMITRRKEKSQSYYACPECETWHHQNSGFFDLDRFETVPLTNSEVNGQLYRVKLDYAPSDFDQSEWHYGTKESLQNKASETTWEKQTDIESV